VKETFGAEAATSDAVKARFAGARAAGTSDVAVAVTTSGARAVVGPAVAVPSNAVVAVAVVTPNRGAAGAAPAEERLPPAAVAVGARTNRPTAIRPRAHS
jgi:hypothetical protein